VSHFATIAEPLTELTRARHLPKVKWSYKCEEASCKLKKPSILRVPELSKLYILQTDASEKGLDSVLSQATQDGKEHPIAFANRKLLPR